MTLLRPMTAVDAVFVASVAALWVATAAFHFGHRRHGRVVGVLGWAVFALFWAHTAVAYLAASRTFLGVVGFVTVSLAGYAASLVARGRDVGVRLTLAFGVMGIVFLPFEFLDPVHRTVLAAVADHAAWLLSVLGYDPLVGYGPEGYANVIFFAGLPPRYGIRIISACSGISAIALFAGLVTATRTPFARRLRYAVAVGILVYALNIVRAAFVAGALGGAWFGFAVPLTGGLYRVTDPRLASYYVAEYLVSQVLIVLVLLLVYARLSERLPELQALVGGVVTEAIRDWNRVADYR